MRVVIEHDIDVAAAAGDAGLDESSIIRLMPIGKIGFTLFCDFNGNDEMVGDIVVDAFEHGVHLDEIAKIASLIPDDRSTLGKEIFRQLEKHSKSQKAVDSAEYNHSVILEYYKHLN